MKQKSVYATGFALLGVTALVGGCGSGGGSSPAASGTSSGGGDAAFVSSVSRNTGKARLTLQWPAAAASRLIPASANSVKIILLQNSQPIAGTERLLVRPASGSLNLTGTAQWDGLPTGDITVSAVAYPNADGSGVAVAQASVVATLSGSTEKAVALTLASTIDHLQITTGELAPATPLAPATLFKGDTLPLAVSAVDKNNAVVLVGGTFNWTSSDPANAPVTSQSGTAATLAGTEATVTTVSVTDAESGKNASVVVPVTGFAVRRIADVENTNGTINNAGWVLTTDYYSKSGVVQPPYQSITPILPPPGFSNDVALLPFGTNNKGQVVGSITGHKTNGVLVVGAFLQDSPSSPATILPLGSTGVGDPRRFRAISVFNDNGLALLSYADSTTQEGSKPAVLDTTTGAVTDIPFVTQINGANAYASFNHLTNGNLLVGGASSYTNSTQVVRGAVAAIGGDITLIPPLSGDNDSQALDGNALGQIVGASIAYLVPIGSGGDFFSPPPPQLLGPAPTHPIVWTAAGGTIALPTLPGFSNGYAKIINGNGLILGEVFSDTTIESKIVLWLNNRPRDVNQMLTGARTGYKVRGVFGISDTNYISASDDSVTVQHVLVPVTHKP